MAVSRWSSFMRIRVFSAAPALVFAAWAGFAAAQEVVATAKNEPAGGAPAAAKPAEIATIEEQQDLEDGPPPKLGFCGPVGVDVDGKPDKSIHGQVGVAVGTRGYRAYHLAACKPFGKDGTSGVAISVTQSQIGRRR